jgi:hypothetical protein
MNDGRPPDTSVALKAYDAADTKLHLKKTKKVTFAMPSDSFPGSKSQSTPPSQQQPHINELILYQWSGGNSCFFDVGLALWFEAYRQWPSQTRKMFLKSIPAATVVSSIFHHYERRIKWLATGRGGILAGRRELSLGQEVARHGIFSQLKLYEYDGAYGCSRHWMARVISVSLSKLTLQE